MAAVLSFYAAGSLLHSVCKMFHRVTYLRLRLC